MIEKISSPGDFIKFGRILSKIILFSLAIVSGALLVDKISEELLELITISILIILSLLLVLEVESRW